MFDTSELLKIIIEIINRLAKTNYVLSGDSEFRIVDSESGMFFTFSGDTVSILDLPFYLADIISKYPFLIQMLEVIDIFYHGISNTIEITEDKKKWIIQITIRQKEISDAFDRFLHFG